MEFTVFLLSALGILISVYFTGVYYKWMKPDTRWIPTFCRLKEKTCANVLETPRAKIFGIPNSLLGIFTYSYIILDIYFFPDIAGLILIFTALVRSIYLAYSLIFVTKIPCTLCFTSHGINFLLFLIYLKRVLG